MHITSKFSTFICVNKYRNNIYIYIKLFLKHGLLFEVCDSINRIKNVWFEWKNHSTLKLSAQVGSDFFPLRHATNLKNCTPELFQHCTIYTHTCSFISWTVCPKHFISDSYIASSVPYNNTTSIVSYNNQNTWKLLERIGESNRMQEFNAKYTKVAILGCLPY